MTALTELKGQNDTHKQLRHVKGKHGPLKQQDGGLVIKNKTEKF